MEKIGYVPVWTEEHTRVLEEYMRRKDDPTFVSETFKTPEEAIEWMNR